MKKNGFSIVELVVGFVAGSTVALMVYLLISPYQNVLFTLWRRGGMMEGQAAMTRMLYEIGRIKSNTQITTFDADHLVFVDIDNQTIDFQKSDSDITRNSDILIRNIQALTFEYLDQNGAVTATAAQIKIIRILLTITSGNQTVHLQSAAGVRND